MHLKTLKLKNFKSHPDSVIEFDLITSITGKNDSGKTNVLRALKLLLHHGDWPATWIRYGQDSASIELELVNGTIITRKRTKTAQSVTIQTKDKIEVFEGKKDATEFIANAVGIKKIVLDETTGPEDLNFVEVHDGPYLIGGRADTVQRKVAGIVGANKIDDARSRLLKKVKDLDSQLNVVNSDIGNLNPIVESCRTSLESIQNILQDAEDLNKQWTNNETKLQILYNLSNHLDSLTSSIPTDNVVKNITDLYKNIKDLDVRLKAVIATLNSASQLYTELNSPLYSTKGFDKVKKMRAEIKGLESQLIETEASLTFLTELTDVNESYAYAAREKDETEVELTKAREELKAKLKELGICPLCNSKI
jgi:DNA repair exonuclease SbcCD ATPase subunit